MMCPAGDVTTLCYIMIRGRESLVRRFSFVHVFTWARFDYYARWSMFACEAARAYVFIVDYELLRNS